MFPKIALILLFILCMLVAIFCLHAGSVAPNEFARATSYGFGGFCLGVLCIMLISK